MFTVKNGSKLEVKLLFAFLIIHSKIHEENEGEYLYEYSDMLK